MRTARFLSTLAITGALSFTAASAAHAQNAPAAQGLSIDGALHANDPADAEGRHQRTRTIRLNAGEGVDVSVASEAFDTMVRVTAPDGSVVAENDDAPDEGLNSRARFRATQAGVYRITVTSYTAGATGEYHLEVQRGVDVDNADPGGGQNDPSEPGDPGDPGEPSAQPPSAPMPTAPGGYDPNVGTYGGTWVGQQPTVMPPAAQPGNTQGYPPAPPGFVMISPGVYVAQGYAPPPGGYPTPGYGGQPTAQPNYGGQPGYGQPGVGQPGGWAGAPTAPMPNYGGATPPGYGQPVDPNAVPPGPAPAGNGAGTVYGIFVGISDYGGGNNLEYTAQDAVQLSSAFQRTGVIRHGNAIVLTDGEATANNVRRAFQTVAQRATERDTVVFFHDGHGNSNSIALRSGPMSSAELSRLLDQVRGQQLIVLDSCYSGSFASIVRGRPNRMALLSSTASETSYVASEVNAGGWLAYFMIQGVGGGVAGGPTGLQFGELASYVQRGYNQRVGGRQHLVVTSGSGNQNAVLWSSPRGPNTVARR